MGTPKPRILPWLISQLDQGHIEGVAWLDAQHLRFRIPWKHHLRQDAKQEDFRIFQAWAEVSGAYNPEKDKPDPPTWKRNFRSALNRKDVLHVVQDNSKDPVDPHKVYEFVTPGIMDFPDWDPSPDPNDKGSTLDTQEDILEDLLNDMALGPVPEAAPSGLAMAPEQPPPPFMPNPVAEVCAVGQNPAPLANPLRHLLIPEDEWEFEVTAFYRGRQVFQQAVYSRRGLQLVGSETADGTLPGPRIVLPDPEAMLRDKVAVDYVRRVLSSLGGGLALWRTGQQLWAQRLGHCATFWVTGEEQLPSGTHGEVPKDRGDIVFNLGPFVADLIAFIEGSRHSPRYTLWFCIGQPWPQDEPWTKRLLMVKVVPTCLRALLDMARVGGASSLETVDLHISNSVPLTLTSDQYKAYLQDLVEDMDYLVEGSLNY
ncbi:PREDICTED: interferon regulatory factor 3 [Elephantulus edwardii]|uniref:interferon regulatory factor 3 n=1 Tax=Elephantulus edwardii TaxID=28737 RepID=UPI0003F0B3B7|nr:PREDICTED: interferon regulatory factor 3 [Elephantulus edwardii]